MTRVANYTIKGFLYQFNVTLLAILDSQENSVTTVEGLIEDIDIAVTFPRLLYHYILEYPALIDSASTGMPVENFSVSCLINSSGVRFPSELCGLAVL